MNNLVYIIAFIAVIAVSSFVTREYFPRTETEVRTDTTYVDVPFETIVREEIDKPFLVTIFRTERDTIETIEVVRDTVFIRTTDGATINYNPSFLTQYPTAPKFLQLDVKDGYVEFTGMDVTGSVQSSRWTSYDEFEMTLSDGSWVSFSGRNVSQTQLNHYAETGYLIPQQHFYVGYGASLSRGGWSVEASAYASESPFIRLGLKYQLR